MDWKNEAVSKLKQYEAKRRCLQTIPLELKRLEAAMTSAKTVRTDRPVVSGRGSGPEEMIMNCIIGIEELQRNLEQAELWVETVSSALEVLSPEEREILERFYITPEKGTSFNLADERNVDRKTVYRQKDSALWKFTIALYGCVYS